MEIRLWGKGRIGMVTPTGRRGVEAVGGIPHDSAWKDGPRLALCGCVERQIDVLGLHSPPASGSCGSCFFSSLWLERTGC